MTSRSVKVRVTGAVSGVGEPVVIACSIRACDATVSAASTGASLVPVIVKVMSFDVPSDDLTVNTSDLISPAARYCTLALATL
ncbi:hypothetical protein AFCDBAGC_2646 [Methylobacterium cerastii]|uniref:Uncharacterized protein n=1 Tax=Methylobacterium cerastii TaxID=932741 RepID=A0ABQ4QJ60_9HYPH|nr:hypothetical protein AFCDBAGC_2646 [Methylobacterium cerastii]